MAFVVLVLISILVVSLYLIFKFLHKVWFHPIYIQSVLGSQGIKGPPYKFLHGNTKQIRSLTMESMSKGPMELSHEILPRIQPHVHLWVKTYGRIFLSWNGPRPQLTIADPDLVKEILLNNKEGAYGKPKAEGFMKKLLGDSIFFAEGKRWARNRKIAEHAFLGKNLKGMVPAMFAAVENMLEKWEKHEGKEIEVFEESKLLMADVISRTAFGSSYVEGMDIFNMMTQLGNMLVANSLKIRVPGIGKIWRTNDDIESDRLAQNIYRSVIQMIKNREEKVKLGELDGYGSDYLGLLIKANKDSDDSKRITIDEIVDECKSFYAAGHETTASLLTSTCFLLALHTDWQDKARNEVLELFGEKTPSPDDSSIYRLNTMTMIINEALRLYPPVLTYFREVTKEVKFGKLIIPANIDINIPPLVLHHDPEIWGEDVHLFKPERFSEGVIKAANNNTMAFLPFGAGARSCVGSNFAMNETRIALTMILQRYEFTLSPTYVNFPVNYLTIRPLHGLQIILHPR